MADSSHGRTRYRLLELPTGSAESWLERHGETVEANFAYKWAKGSNSGGGGGWRHCTHNGCLGEAIGQSGPCLQHADQRLRRAYLAQIAASKGVLRVRGQALSQTLYDEIHASPIFIDGTPVIPLSFAWSEISARIRFEGKRFGHWVDFSGAEVLSKFVFTDCVFDAPVTGRYMFFNAGAPAFSRCKFLQDVDISCSEAKQVSIAFQECSFERAFNAEGITGPLLLDKSSFGGDVLVRNAEAKHLKMDDCVLRSGLDIAHSRLSGVHANRMNAERVNQLGPFTSQFTMLNQAKFASRLRIEITSGRLELIGASLLQGGVILADATEINLDQISLGNTLRVSGRVGATSVPEILGLVASDAGKISLARTNLTRCSFYGAHDLGSIDIESTVMFPVSPWWAGRRRYIADEYAWRVSSGRSHSLGWTLPGVRVGPAQAKYKEKPLVELPILSASQVAATYRDLRRSLEAKSEMSGAADFYYGEMEMRRWTKEARYVDTLIVTLYWLLSGYGLRASRAAFAWLLFVFVGAASMSWGGFSKDAYSLGRGLIFAARAALPGVSTTEILTSSGQLVEIALRIGGPVLTALFLLAVRGRIVRKPT